MDFAEDFYAFGFGYAFEHRLVVSLFVHLTLDYCEVSDPMLKPIGLVAVGWMVMALKVQCYWGPPVFGHYKVDDPVAVGVLRCLQTFGITDGWCADDMVEHVGCLLYTSPSPRDS